MFDGYGNIPKMKPKTSNKKKPVKKINKKDVEKGLETEEKYEKQIRKSKAGKAIPVQAKIGLKAKDIAVKKVKKNLNKKPTKR